jgi:uncharacterized protein with PIN domain
MNGSIIDTNVIIRMLHGDPDAIALFKKIEKAYDSMPINSQLQLA